MQLNKNPSRMIHRYKQASLKFICEDKKKKEELCYIILRLYRS